MDPTIQIIKQDVKAALEYFNAKEFELVGKMGNRIMSNLLIGEKKELMILGYLIKEVSDDFDFIKKEYSLRLNVSMDAGALFIQNISNSIPTSGEFDELKVWEDCFDYKKQVVEFTPTDIERSAYRKSPDFITATTPMFMDFLDKNRSLLLENYNNLLTGILKEINRIIILHGFAKRDLIFYMLLKAFREYYLYLLAFKIESGLEGDVIKDKIYIYVDRITNLPSELDELSREANEILAEMGYQTRVFSIENLDPKETMRKFNMNE